MESVEKALAEQREAIERIRSTLRTTPVPLTLGEVIAKMLEGESARDLGISLSDPIREAPEFKIAALLQYHRAEYEAAKYNFENSIGSRWDRREVYVRTYNELRGLQLGAAAIGMPVMPLPGMR